MEVREGMSSVVLAVGPGHTLREAAAEDDREGDRRGARLRRASRRRRGSSPSATCSSRSATARTRTRPQVADHMSDSIISAPPDWSLERAAEEMVKLGIRHLVVVDRGELVGVLSMRDIVRCLDARRRDQLDQPAVGRAVAAAT